MNIEPLFRKFDELADSPERIPALRKVILACLVHSAVTSPEALLRGRKLREDHERQRTKNMENAIRRKSTKIPEVTFEDLPRSLSDFPVALFERLGNIASIEKGLSQIQRTTPGEYPLVVTAESRSSSDSHDFEGPAAIVPLVSSTGHGDASLKRLHYQEGQYAVGNILAVVQPICPNLIRARFIYEYLSAFKDELLVSRMVGTANVSLTVNKLNEVPVPLVSGAVMSRIDELMVLCDRLEAQQQERRTRHTALARASLSQFVEAPTPTNLDLLFHETYTIEPADLRKSILTLAVQGKLVPQDPNDEPAVTSVGLVSKDAKKAIREGIIRLQGLAEPADDSNLSELSPGWRWTRLSEIVNPVPFAIKRGPFGSAIRKDMFVPDGFKVYEQQHAISGDFTKGRYYINEAKFEELKAFELHPNEILVSCSGTVGKVAIVPANIEKGIINQALLKLSLHQAALLNEYFLILFPAFFMETDTLTNLSGTAQKNIPGMDVLKAMPFPLPPVAEQRRIVAKVDQLMRLVDQLETQLAASRAVAANLLEAFVAELIEKA